MSPPYVQRSFFDNAMSVIVGAEVPELIQGFVIAMGLKTTEEVLMHIVFPHLTLSEMMHESVLDAYGRVIHI